MPFQKHVDVPAPSVTPKFLVKCFFYILGSDDLSCFSFDLKLCQNLAFFSFAHIPMIPAVFPLGIGIKLFFQIYAYKLTDAYAAYSCHCSDCIIIVTFVPEH